VKVRTLFVLAACAAAVPLHAQEWRFEQIGSFRYRARFDPITDRDQSEVEARTAHERLGGVPSFVAWGCHEEGLRITITASDAGDSERVRMVYRFDRERPDTVAVATWSRGRALWVPRELQHSFTTRARSANLLVVRLIHAGGESDRYFDLTGSNRALERLACVRDLRPGTPPPPEARAERPAPPPVALSDGAYELSAVEEAPALINRQDVVRALQRNYPPGETGGQVDLRIRVLATGAVDPEAIRVERSTNPVFDEPARRVAATMLFTPARVNGQAVNVWITLPVQFAVSPD
jgi:TonB family protein